MLMGTEAKARQAENCRRERTFNAIVAYAPKQSYSNYADLIDSV